MFTLKKNAARIATAALIATTPAVVSATQSGSPQQSVVNDPDEKVERKIPVTGESMEDTPKADQGEGAYDDAEITEDSNGSLIEDDAKADG